MVQLTRTILLVAVLAGGLLFLASGIQDTHLESFRITGLTDIDASGFVFTADITLTNPSRLPIPITNITYNASLNRTGEVLSTGEFDAFTLTSGESSTQVSSRINWKSSVRTATDLFVQEEVPMDVRGAVYIDLFLLDAIRIPFYEQTDIKAALLGQENRFETTQLPPNSDTTSTVTDSNSTGLDELGQGLI